MAALGLERPERGTDGREIDGLSSGEDHRWRGDAKMAEGMTPKGLEFQFKWLELQFEPAEFQFLHSEL